MSGPKDRNAPMTDRELRERLTNIYHEARAARIAARDRRHTFIIFALIVLLLRGC